MKSSWFKGLNSDLEKEIRGDYASSRVTRHRLRDMLEEKIKTSRNTALNKEGYDVANWALKQADLIGYERALKDVIELISDDEK